MDPSIVDVLSRIRPLDSAPMVAAARRHRQLTKPFGALGRLEDVSVVLAGVSGQCPPPVPSRPVVAVFAGDHGVHAQGVTPWPVTVTAAMVENFRVGGAAVNVLARGIGAEVVVVDVGVAGDVRADAAVWDRKVRRGTADLSRGSALTDAEVEQAVLAGIDVAMALIDNGHDILLTGDMGIGNTTPSACLIAAFCGAGAERVTGRGSGADDRTFARKRRVVEAAVARLPADAGPLVVAGAVGGLEHAALAGLLLAAAARSVPVILDGVIAGAAALIADALAPHALSYCLAGHRSADLGHRIALERLKLQPLLDLDLRLGEGTGAVLAYPLVRSAAAVLTEMATFESAGIDHG
ncbi:MAG: nicotinate-nucleotide--dimethylbenzimidazole phosphoribosyltransferase [Nocardioides sp.]